MRDLSTGTPPVLADPLQRLIDRVSADSARRSVIGLAGPPGSGKSTLAAYWVRELNRRLGTGSAVVLGMDGFHLTREQLARMPDPAAALARRGAPWTFDPMALTERLRLLRAMPADPSAGGVAAPARWPAFEHAIGDPVQDAIAVAPTVRLVLVEGLYLLHLGDGWDLTGLLDECWYLDVRLDAALERLTRRHMASWGLSLSQARARVGANDGLNAAIVATSRLRADWLIDGRHAGAAAGPARES